MGGTCCTQSSEEGLRGTDPVNCKPTAYLEEGHDPSHGKNFLNPPKTLLNKKTGTQTADTPSRMGGHISFDDCASSDSEDSDGDRKMDLHTYSSMSPQPAPVCGIEDRLPLSLMEAYQQRGGFEFRLQDFPGKHNAVETLQEAGNQIYSGGVQEDSSGRKFKQGQGYFYVKDTFFFAGYFKNDSFQGPGVLITHDLSFFKGIWKRNKLNGYGELYSPNGRIYRGNWRNSLQEGFGEETWDDSGSYYKGQFQEGARHGEGELYLAQQDSKYKGNFNKNSMEGYGVLIYKDGKKYIGCWKNDLMHGKGLFEWPDKRLYEGEYVFGKKHGHGVFRWPNGRVYTGQWENGVQSGEGTIRDAKGEVKSGIWENGFLVSANPESKPVPVFDSQIQ